MKSTKHLTATPTTQARTNYSLTTPVKSRKFNFNSASSFKLQTTNSSLKELHQAEDTDCAIKA